jgi:histidine ammonia-lyase
MGSVAARKAMAIIANTAHVLAIELICACQALDLQSPLRASPAIRALCDAVRQTVAFTETDRALSEDVKSTAQRILAGEFVAAVQAILGHEVR